MEIVEMIVKILRSWCGHEAGDIIEMILHEGRRAIDVGIAAPPTLEEVRRHVLAETEETTEKPPEDKTVCTVQTETKVVASRKKKIKKKLAGKRSENIGSD